MKPLTAIDALRDERDVINVVGENRPPKVRKAGAIFAVFASASDTGEWNNFLGVVTDKEISIFPSRIFQDLTPQHPVTPALPDTPLDEVRNRMEVGNIGAIPVIKKDGTYIGIVCRSSILEALLDREKKLLKETQRLSKVVKADQAHLIEWSKRLQELHSASRTLLGLLAHTSIETDVLQGGIEALTKLIYARYGAIGIIDAHGQLKQFVYTGVTPEQAAAMPHLPEGKGLLGVVVNENAILRLDDLSSEPRSGGFPPNHPSMKSLLAVPISRLGHVYGRIYLCDKVDGEPFSSDDELLALSFSHSLSLVLDNAREMTEIKSAQERLDYMAHYDALTGLPNRTLFTDRLKQALAYAQRNDLKLAILFIDLDNFKVVNDTLGHMVGDKLLSEVASELTACIREVDTVARLGGDEFTILLTNIKELSDITKVAQKVLNAVAKPYMLDGNELFVSTSIGISVYPDDDKSMDNLIRNADTALYHAKAHGKNTFNFYTSEMNERVQKRAQYEKRLRNAVKNQEFYVHYQPQVEIRTGRIIGVEALLRLNNEDGIPIPPNEFIHIAEETGLIVPIGEWVLYTACAQNVKWQRLGMIPVRMAVNISANQFRRDDFVQTVNDVLHKTGLEPRLLELEITESILVNHEDWIVSAMNDLRSTGVSFSIDDFGTGYSSLSYLKRFPVSTLKIDISFIRHITTNQDDAAIALAITSMAHSLKLNVVAEGVENSEQLAIIQNQGCDNVQGFLIAKPMLPTDFLAWWQKENTGSK